MDSRWLTDPERDLLENVAGIIDYYLAMGWNDQVVIAINKNFEEMRILRTFIIVRIEATIDDNGNVFGRREMLERIFVQIGFEKDIKLLRYIIKSKWDRNENVIIDIEIIGRLSRNSVLSRFNLLQKF